MFSSLLPLLHGGWRADGSRHCPGCSVAVATVRPVPNWLKGIAEVDGKAKMHDPPRERVRGAFPIQTANSWHSQLKEFPFPLPRCCS